MRQLMALSYVLVLQELQRQLDNLLLAATLAAVMGAQVEAPEPAQIRAQFDEDLAREPQRDTDDPEKRIMLRALGLRD